jgi:hypothetical protein
MLEGLEEDGLWTDLMVLVGNTPISVHKACSFQHVVIMLPAFPIGSILSLSLSNGMVMQACLIEHDYPMNIEFSYQHVFEVWIKG